MEKPDGFYPFLAKVFGDTLIQNGHEHISLMPFLLLNNHPLEAWGTDVIRPATCLKSFGTKNIMGCVLRSLHKVKP